MNGATERGCDGAMVRCDGAKVRCDGAKVRRTIGPSRLLYCTLAPRTVVPSHRRPVPSSRTFATAPAS